VPFHQPFFMMGFFFSFLFFLCKVGEFTEIEKYKAGEYSPQSWGWFKRGCPCDGFFEIGSHELASNHDPPDLCLLRR
jgi:hypothetical protein